VRHLGQVRRKTVRRLWGRQSPPPRRGDEEQGRRYNDEQADMGRDLLARSGYVATETDSEAW
jgi:hypothetical protein